MILPRYNVRFANTVFKDRQRYFLPLLLLVALGAMIVSLAIGMHQSVWFDEAYSIMVAKKPIGELLRLTALDTHPPLYYVLLKGWGSLFGWSELALRSLSVSAMGGAIVVAGLLLRRIFGARIALISILFVALAPMLIRYGFEIRMYAPASFIGILATYVLTRAIRAESSSKLWLYALYSLLVAVGVYTLYYLALLWMAHVVWVAYATLKAKQPLLKSPWLVAYLGSVVLFLPWLPTFISQISNGALAPISQPLTLDNIVSIITFGFLYQPIWQLNAVMSLVAVAVMVVCGAYFLKARTKIAKKHAQYFMLFWLYILVPILILALVSIFRPMYIERYIAHVIIGGYVLLGLSCAIVAVQSTLTARLGVGLAVAVLACGVVRVADVGNYNFQRLQTPTVKQAALALSSCRDGATILAADPYVAIELSYYVTQCPVQFYSEWSTLKGGYAPLSGSPLQVKNPSSVLVSSRGILYVYYDKPTLTMPDGFTNVATQQFGALKVARFSK